MFVMIYILECGGIYLIIVKIAIILKHIISYCCFHVIIKLRYLWISRAG